MKKLFEHLMALLVTPQVTKQAALSCNGFAL
jgi:hypothetical protein